MCSLFLLILHMWYLSNVFKDLLFSLFLLCAYSHVCVLCSVTGSSILICCYCFKFSVYVLYIWCKMFGPFALSILVGNPCIYFGKWQLSHIFLFVDVVLLCFALCFVFGMLLFIHVSLKFFVSFFVPLPVYVKVTHFVFWCCGSAFLLCLCWLVCLVPRCITLSIIVGSSPFASVATGYVCALFIRQLTLVAGGIQY
jgi:hypothetical protein